jgi:hypothetical protein
LKSPKHQTKAVLPLGRIALIVAASGGLRYKALSTFLRTNLFNHAQMIKNPLDQLNGQRPSTFVRGHIAEAASALRSSDRAMQSFLRLTVVAATLQRIRLLDPTSTK